MGEKQTTFKNISCVDSCDHRRRQYLIKKLKDNKRYKVQNISVLKFLKESTSENNAMGVEMIYASFIIEHNISIAW